MINIFTIVGLNLPNKITMNEIFNMIDPMLLQVSSFTYLYLCQGLYELLSDGGAFLLGKILQIFNFLDSSSHFFSYFTQLRRTKGRSRKCFGPKKDQLSQLWICSQNFFQIFHNESGHEINENYIKFESFFLRK